MTVSQIFFYPRQATNPEIQYKFSDYNPEIYIEFLDYLKNSCIFAVEKKHIPYGFIAEKTTASY